MVFGAPLYIECEPATLPVPAWFLITALIGLTSVVCFCILLTTWLLNRRADPHYAKLPPDPP